MRNLLTIDGKWKKHFVNIENILLYIEHRNTLRSEIITTTAHMWNRYIQNSDNNMLNECSSWHWVFELNAEHSTCLRSKHFYSSLCLSFQFEEQQRLTQKIDWKIEFHECKFLSYFSVNVKRLIWITWILVQFKHLDI